MEILSLINLNTLKGLEIQFVHHPFFFPSTRKKKTPCSLLEASVECCCLMPATQVAATALPSPQTAPHLHLEDCFVSEKYFINTKEKSVCLLFKQSSTHILKLSTCLFFYARDCGKRSYFFL